ncbi:MAG: T9SS type A sorting domain-containing protein [Crocinitomicaceae bacterium]
MKTIITPLLFASVLTFSFTSSFAQSYENLPFSIVKVYENPSNHAITVAWNDNRIDEIEILTSKGILMPTIPVFDSKQIHLNGLEDGTYYLNFKSKGQILQTKLITVENTELISKL